MKLQSIKNKLQFLIKTFCPDVIWNKIKRDTEFFAELIKVTNFLPDNCKIAERIYCVLNNILDKESKIKCANCQEKEVAFESLRLGYVTYCCSSCRKKGVSNSCLETFSKESSEKRAERINKGKKTLFEKYWVENMSQVPEFKEKMKQTCREKYWTEHYATSEFAKEKKKQTEIEKYWMEYFQTEEFKEKTKQSNLEKYWVEFTSQRSDIKEKIIETNVERYWVSSYLQTEHSREEMKKILRTDNVKEKRKATNNLIYWWNTPFSSLDVIERCKQKNIEKYWVDWVSKRPEINEKVINTKKQNTQSSVDETIKKFNLPIQFIDFDLKTRDKTFHCKICEKNFFISKDLFVKRLLKLKRWILNNKQICTNCNDPHNFKTSNKEKELVKFLKEIYTGEIVENTKSVIKPKELDIYIPDIKLAIEFNWIYWHSEFKGEKERNYHLMKSNMCSDKWIRLIHVFEDEWDNKNEICRTRILYIILNSLSIYKLDKSKFISENVEKNEIIYWRKCEINEISTADKNEFLTRYHIQWTDNSSIKLWLFYKDRLIWVMTFSKPNISKWWHDTIDWKFELSRFALRKWFQVVGWASKMFEYFIKNYNPSEVYSYADRRWNTGAVYLNLGFEFDRETDINYWYIIDNERVHRYNYRKNILLKKYPEYNTKINEITNDLYTEIEIMIEQWFDRIWDCWSFKFVWKKK